MKHEKFSFVTQLKSLTSNGLGRSDDIQRKQSVPTYPFKFTGFSKNLLSLKTEF